MKIIIVEDNHEFRATLRFFIEQKLKHIVISDVSSGEDFLNLDSQILNSADIVLMDIMMNQLSGIETTQKVTWNNKNLKVIAITMLVEKIFLIQILGAGFKGCLLKPNVFLSLEKALQKVYSGRMFIDQQILTS